MGEDSETPEVINMFEVTQGAAEPGLNFRLSDSKAYFTSTLLTADCVSIHLRTGSGH
jgi:hypothetical protein